jgi:hypothetical protein
MEALMTRAVLASAFLLFVNASETQDIRDTSYLHDVQEVFNYVKENGGSTLNPVPTRAKLFHVSSRECQADGGIDAVAEIAGSYSTLSLYFYTRAVVASGPDEKIVVQLVTFTSGKFVGGAVASWPVENRDLVQPSEQALRGLMSACVATIAKMLRANQK